MINTHKIKLILLAALCLGCLRATCYAQGLQDPALTQVLEKIKAVYGVSLHYAEEPRSKLPHLSYSLANAEDSEDLKKAILIFAREISLYPKNFFRDAYFEDIYFVQKFFYKDKPADGMFSGGKNYIIYDYARNSGKEQKIRHYIHHELFHMVGNKRPFWKEHGPVWEGLNRRGFSYNQKRNPRERNPINFYAPSEPGFITDYAMTSAEEDRAEVFACMMVPEELSLMEQWAQKDSILFKKIEMMREFIKEAYN